MKCKNTRSRRKTRGVAPLHRLTSPFLRTRSVRYGKRAFLLCNKVWSSCCVTISHFYHDTWWCRRNSPCIRYGRCVDAALQLMVLRGAK